jgi:hypothetical protein
MKMVFNLLVIVLVGVVAYFHYLQGLFSAMLSAVFAVTAALLAIGYHELLVESFLGGKFADYAYGIGLVVIFATVYIVLRLIADKLIPGNVQYPLWVDRIGAIAMGAIAGVCGVGVLAIAAQALPLGGSIAMFERYPVAWNKEAPMRVGSTFTQQMATFDQVDSEKFVKNESSRLMLPADTLVLALAGHVSGEGASLGTGRPLTSIHPDYLQELFGQRIGVQLGAKQTAMAESVQVAGIYTAGGFPQDDQERWERDGAGVGIRQAKVEPPPADLPTALKAAPEHMLLVVRVKLDTGSTDEKTGMVSFGPGSARLVIKRRSENRFENFYPLGTLESGRVVLRNAPDDYLFAPGGKAVDLVYEVPTEDATEPRTDKAAPMKLAAGTLFEFKRMARVKLGGKAIKSGVEDSGGVVEVVRKQGLNPKLAANAGKTSTAPLSVQGQPEVSSRLFTKINVGTPDRDAKGEQDWGAFQLKGGKFVKLDLRPTRTIRVMEQGQIENLAQEFDVAAQVMMVQVHAKPSARSQDKWAWADTVGDFELVDNAGKRYKPCGVVVKVNNNGQDMLLAMYDSQKPVTSIAAEQKMRPTDVTLLYLVEPGVDIKLLEYKREIVQMMQFEVK